MKRTRYPIDIAHAAPGKLVRTRTRSRDADGQPSVAYIARQILPLPESFTQQGNYIVQAGDRIDNVAARLLGDPKLYWMLLEANGASNPALLCAVPGRSLIVPAVAGQSQSAFGQPASDGRSSAAPATHHRQDVEDPS